MKTILLIIICLCCIGIGAYCQTFSEWFFQKKTRIKRLQQQIAALEALKAILQKGYWQTEEGVDSIHFIEQEGFDIDKDFITHLQSVKPAFKYGSEVVACYEVAHIMRKWLELWRDKYSRSPWLRLREINRISADLIGIIKMVNERLAQLNQLISDDHMDMEDGERWDAIREIEIDIRSAFEASTRCITGVERLIQFREQQAANDAYLKSILQ
jgi:hypothetical protein